MAGCEVIVGASSQDKIDRLKALGADWGINYAEEQFEKAILESMGSLIGALLKVELMWL